MIEQSEFPEVDSISRQLEAEFWEHVKEVQAHNPALTNRRIIFEAWSIQKIAALQSVVLTQNKTINGLIDGLNRLIANKR